MIERLAHWLSSFAIEQAPDAVRQRGLLCLLDAIGVGLAGALHPIVSKAEQGVAALGGTGRSTVLGGRTPRNLAEAALLNGTAMQVHDFDDLHLPSRTHPTVVILPAALAVAEAMRSPGRDVLAAYLAGYQIETAIGEALLPAHYARGWHATATLGGFGASAAAARLLGLDAERMAHALNLAGTQAGGVRAVFGGSFKHVQPGKAAMNGVLAAAWAAAGLSAGADTLADRLGFAAAAVGIIPRLPEDLSAAWAIEHATLKLLPCCFESHSSVELAQRLRAAGLAPDDLDALTIRVHPDVAALVGQPEPESGEAAKFSMPHCVALALVRGTVAFEDFEQDPRAPGPVTDARRRVRVVTDPGLAYTEAIGVAIARDGEERSERVLHVRGSPQRPLTADEVGGKFLGLAAPRLGVRRAQELKELVLSLERLPDMAPIFAFIAEPQQKPG